MIRSMIACSCSSACGGEPRPRYPIEELGQAVDLVVVLAGGDLQDLVLKVLQPGGTFGQEHVARLDLGAWGQHARHLVALGRDADRPYGAFAPQLLDQGDARARVLDEDRVGGVPFGLGHDPTLEVRKDQALAQHRYQVIAAIVLQRYRPRQRGDTAREARDGPAVPVRAVSRTWSIAGSPWAAGGRPRRACRASRSARSRCACARRSWSSSSPGHARRW